MIKEKDKNLVRKKKDTYRMKRPPDGFPSGQSDGKVLMFYLKLEELKEMGKKAVTNSPLAKQS
jgi:hypothetical protein